MVKDNDQGWALPRRKPITKEVLDRAIEVEKTAAFREHHVREVQLAGLTTSAAKAAASARNGQLGGRPKSKVRQHG